MVILLFQVVGAIASLCTIARFVKEVWRDHVQRTHGNDGEGGEKKGRG